VNTIEANQEISIRSRKGCAALFRADGGTAATGFVGFEY
jgi:hypothetical protein